MTPEDERLADLIYQVRALAPLVGMVARHDAELEGQKTSNARIERLITEVRDECRERDRRQRWTPAQWSVVIAAFIASAGTLIGVVLSGGAG